MRVCITGASRGVGKAVALGFAAQGAELTLIGRSSAAQQAVLDEIAAMQRASRVDFLECDFADLSQVEQVSQDLALKCAFDVVIHNAGIIERAEVDVCSL